MHEWLMDRKLRHLLTNDEDFVRVAIAKMSKAPDDTFTRHWMKESGHFLTFGKDFEFEDVAQYLEDFVGIVPKEYRIVYSHRPPYVRDQGYLKVELIPDVVTTAEIIHALQDEDLTITSWREFEVKQDYVEALRLDGALPFVRRHRDLVVMFTGLNDVIGSVTQRGVVAQGMSFGVVRTLPRPDRDLNATQLEMMCVASCPKKTAGVQTERPPQLFSKAVQTLPPAHGAPTTSTQSAKKDATRHQKQDPPKKDVPPKKDGQRQRPKKDANQLAQEQTKKAKRKPKPAAPQQCYRCQLWGNHLANHCSAPLRCRRFAGSHASKGCEEQATKCTNCGEAHQASSRRCKARPKADHTPVARDSARRTKPAPGAVLGGGAGGAIAPPVGSASTLKRGPEGPVTHRRHCKTG